MTRIAAFFDVDETIINIKSMFHFYDYWYKQKGLIKEGKEYIAQFKMDVKNGKCREQLNKEYYQQFRDISFDELSHFGEKWFNNCLSEENFISRTVNELRKHQQKGDTVVFVSGSMQPILQPIANKLNVEEILCAPLVINHKGYLTGEIGTPQTIGGGKKEALLAFCRRKGFSPENCYSYGDDISDVPMLEITGHPVCVGDNKQLFDYASIKGWRQI